MKGERQAWAMRFNLTLKREKQLTHALMSQLSHCRSDECRRLILGLSQRENARLPERERSRGKLKSMPVKQIRRVS